jgi:ankyrin repeat protein
MSSLSPSRLNLQQQRKRAKELRRAHAAGQLEAAVRIARHLPGARRHTPREILGAAFTLSDAQCVIARESGFSSWPEMKRHIEIRERPASDLEAILDAALGGDDLRVRAAIDRHRAVIDDSIHLAAALADADVVVALLDADPVLANQPGGRRMWPPLLYLCYSRYRASDAAADADRVRIARALIAAGADVNAKGHEVGLTSFNVTLFDQEEWHPLEAAAGRLVSPGIVGVLIDAGADVGSAPIVLSQAVRGGSTQVLERLLAAAPRDWWAVRWALLACVMLERIDLARTIVAATREQDPTQASPDRALVEAVRLGRDRDWIQLLLGSDRTPEATIPMRQEAYRTAVRYGHRDAAALLLQHGANDAAVDERDRVIGACLAGDGTRLAELRSHRRGAWAFGPDDHRMLAWAVRNRRQAVPLLLDTGLDPDTPDGDGDTPLHLAVRAGAIDAVDALLRAGAAADARNFDDQTPLETALTHADAALREQLTRTLLEAGATPAVERPDMTASFERAADAVVSGELEALRTLLDEQPALVRARSPRPHRATLLHYAVANGVEQPRQRMPANAPAITGLLLARGADANATCNLYGGGATPLGLLITSAIPRELGLDGEMVGALARGGARVGTDDLVHCIAHGLPRSARALVEAGVPVDNLLTAAGLGDTRTLEDLLARGANVNERYEGASTALHAAATHGHTDAVLLLLRRGADAGLRNVWGGTPAGTARYFGQPDTASLIEGYRAGSSG